MNRPIKFRVWDDKLRVMTKGGGLTAFADEQQDCIALTASLDLEDVPATTWKYRFEIMQWSGLTLLNGTDIYEGDILNTKAARWEVVFERGSFVAKWLMGQGDKDTHQILWPMMEYAILLGNRFENPHLLTDNLTGYLPT